MSYKFRTIVTEVLPIDEDGNILLGLSSEQKLMRDIYDGGTSVEIYHFGPIITVNRVKDINNIELPIHDYLVRL